MIEGLWIVQFHGPQGVGHGVIVLVRGQVLGGDSGFAFTGTYELKESTFKARVSVKNIDPSIPNVLGFPGNFDLKVDGSLRGDEITGTGTLVQAPDSKIAMRLKKSADLR
jgi:T3SS negative regulator,GrlR